MTVRPWKPKRRRQIAAYLLLVLCSLAPSLAEERPNPSGKSDNPAANASPKLPPGVIAQLGSSRFRAGGQLKGMRLSPDGRVVAMWSALSQLRFWDVERGELIREIHHINTGIGGPQFVDAQVVWSPDAKHLAVTSRKTVVLLDGRTIADRLELDPLIVQEAAGVRFEPDGKTLIVGRKESACAFDVDSGKFLRELPLANKEKFEPHPFIADPDRPGHIVRIRLATAQGSIINTYDDGKFVQIVTRGPTIVDLDASAGARRIVSGNNDGRIALWTPTEKRKVLEWQGLTSQVDFLGISADGSLVAAGSQAASVGRGQAGNHVRIWKLKTDEQGTVAAVEWLPDDSHNALITSLQYDADGTHLISASNDDEVGIWDLRTRTSRLDRGYIASVSHTKKLLATHGSNDSSRQVRLYELTDPTAAKLLHAFEGTSRAALSLDGRRAAAMKPGSKTLSVWDTATHELVREIECETSPVYRLALSPDGRFAAIGSSPGGMEVWEIESGRRTVHAPKASAHQLCFTPDGQSLVVKRNGPEPLPILVLDVDSGELEYEFGTEGQARIQSVAVFPDNRRLLTGYTDGVIRVWDIPTGALLKELPGHRSGVYALAVKPDGTQFASGAADSTIYLWDAAVLRAKP